MSLRKIIKRIFRQQESGGSRFPEYLTENDRVELANAVIAPLRVTVDKDKSGEPLKPESLRGQSGVYTQDGLDVVHSRHYRNGKFLTFPGNFKAEVTDQRKAIYCGRWFDHFGHFILESLSRLWCADDYPGHVLCWSVPEGKNAAPKNWQQDLIALLCGQREIVLVTQATCFSSVVVPKAGIVIPDYFSRNLTDFLKKKGCKHQSKPGSKIWLSRSRVETDSGLINSAVLDRHLETSGWQLVYPETLSIAEQLNLLATAERVAGEEGSALHMLMFLAGASELKVDIFPRLSRSEQIKKQYELIARRTGFDQTVHDISSERLIERGRGYATRIAADFSEHLNALDIPVKRRDPRRASPTVSERLAEIVKGRSLLQIGTSRKFDFETLTAKTKALVTKTTDIDPRCINGPGESIFQMSLQDYLTWFHPSEKRFDVVLVGEEAGMTEVRNVWESIAGPDTILVDGEQEFH